MNETRARSANDRAEVRENERRRNAVLDALEEPIRAVLSSYEDVHLIALAVQLDPNGGFASASSLGSEHEVMRVLAQCVGVYALRNELPGVTACISETPSTD